MQQGKLVAMASALIFLCGVALEARAESARVRCQDRGGRLRRSASVVGCWWALG
jgi:hypothetical protein